MVPKVAGSSPVVRPSFLKGRSVSFFQALLFGLIQGFCEFLPISSSAHLQFFKYFSKLDTAGFSPIFELVCNLGTTLVTIIYLRKKIIHLLLYERKSLLFIALAIIPLIPTYLFFKSIKSLTYKMELLGLFFIFTSALLFFASNIQKKKKSNSSLIGKIKDVLFIGSMQTLALIPGISRSATTISAGCMRGWHIMDAISFSYILAIPTILGGSLLEYLKLWSKKEPVMEMSFSSYLIGFCASFIAGAIMIRYVFSLKENKKLLPFAWYCLIIGIISLIYFNLF